MAATARSQKGPPLKKPQDQMSNSNTSTPRRNAWGQPNRGPISQIPPYTPNPRSSNGFPPLHVNGKSSPNEEREKLLANLAGNIGSIITVTLRSNVRYEGTLTSVTPSPAEDASLILKDAKDVSVPGAPVKETMTIHAANVASFVPGSGNAPAKSNDNFRTDTEISRANHQKRERELQAWQPDPVADPPNGASPVPLSVPNSSNNLAAFQRSDDVTFGPNVGGTWDQFAANERLFGVTTQFDEDLYTTKLDRSAKDFKERERRAEKIAQEITNSTTSNPHVAEERNMNLVDDSGVNEEDKYSTVVRGTNAYVPPGARKGAGQGAAAPPTTLPTVKEVEKTEVPKVSVNAPDGTEKTMPKSTSPPAGGAPAKAPADALPAFRDFVTNEKQRLTQKKQALVKNEMDKRMADLVKFSQSFKLNKPIPEDLVPILAKDEDKQRQIREKSSKDAASSNARVIGVVSTISAVSPVSGKAPTPVAKLVEARKAAAASSGASPAASATKTAQLTNKSTTMDTPAVPNGTAKVTTSNSTPKITMVIQAIPPFKGKKSSPDAKLPASVSQPLSPISAQRLNVNATSFKPNLKTVSFTPQQNGPATAQAGSSATSSPKVTKATPAQPNPFFGTQMVKKSPPVNIKDDFNPFKHSKIQEASTISAFWPYSGKKYMLVFPAQAPPTQPSPLVPPHAPPPPPTNYDEEAAAQAARGYTAVYAYPAYAYPGQPPHMVAGMPGVPHGAFMPSPYMQPMPYPPTMPPPGGQHMYAPPPMGQMPPHQSYMPPPPPGAYPPPPNGAAPRPSMPPTPIPAHAHAYYHQSPQLQHAVPYPMMIPPPAPNGPPHPYEQGPPPVQMGGVGHA